MSDKTKHRLIIGAILIAIILLWFWLRKNPQAAQVVQKAASDLGLPDLGLMPYVPPTPLNFDGDNLGSYVPAQMPGVQTNMRGYTPCNFCLQSVTKVTTPAPVPVIPPSPTPQQVMMYPAPRSYSSFSGTPANNSRPFDIRTPQGALAMGMGYMGGI